MSSNEAFKALVLFFKSFGGKVEKMVELRRKSRALFKKISEQPMTFQYYLIVKDFQTMGVFVIVDLD